MQNKENNKIKFKNLRKKFVQINWFNLMSKIIFTLGLCGTLIVFIFSLINGWWPITIICGVFSIIFSTLFKKVFSMKNSNYECVWDAKVDGKLNE